MKANLDRPRSHGLGLAGIRMVVGVVFTAYGFHSMSVGLAEMSQSLPIYGFPASEPLAALLIGVELLGGFALLAGLFTRWAAAFLAAFEALLTVLGLEAYSLMAYPRRIGGFFPISIPESSLVVVVLALCLAVGGPGALAADRVIRKKDYEGSRRQARAIGAARILVGMIAFLHGWQKLFVYGLPAVASEFAASGFPVPWLTGLVLTLVELLSGLALISGLFARWAAAWLAIETTVSISFVHLRPGFTLPIYWPSGYDYALVFVVTSVSLVIAGSGSFALQDTLVQACRRWRRGSAGTKIE